MKPYSLLWREPLEIRPDCMIENLNVQVKGFVLRRALQESSAVYFCQWSATFSIQIGFVKRSEIPCIQVLSKDDYLYRCRTESRQWKLLPEKEGRNSMRHWWVNHVCSLLEFWATENALLHLMTHGNCRYADRNRNSITTERCPWSFEFVQVRFNICVIFLPLHIQGLFFCYLMQTYLQFFAFQMY